MFSIVAASSTHATLAVVATGTVQTYITPGTTGALVGQYLITASSSENIQLSIVNVDYDYSNLLNLGVYVGGHQFFRNSHTSSEYDGSYVIPPGGNVLVQVFANAASSATGTSNPATTFDACTAVGESSGVSVPCNSATGQEVIF